MRGLLVSRLMLPLVFASIALPCSVLAFQAKPKKATAAAAQPDQAADIKPSTTSTRDIAASKENDVDTLANAEDRSRRPHLPIDSAVCRKPAIRKFLEHQREQAKDSETTAYDEQSGGGTDHRQVPVPVGID